MVSASSSHLRVSALAPLNDKLYTLQTDINPSFLRSFGQCFITATRENRRYFLGHRCPHPALCFGHGDPDASVLDSCSCSDELSHMDSLQQHAESAPGSEPWVSTAHPICKLKEKLSSPPDFQRPCLHSFVHNPSSIFKMKCQDFLLNQQTS